MKGPILFAALLSLLASGLCLGGITAAEFSKTTAEAFKDADAKPLEEKIRAEALPNEMKVAGRISLAILSDLEKRGAKLDADQSTALAAEISALYQPGDPKLEPQRKQARNKLKNATEAQMKEFIEKSLAPVQKALDEQDSDIKSGKKFDFPEFKKDVHAECEWWPLCWLFG